MLPVLPMHEGSASSANMIRRSSTASFEETVLYRIAAVVFAIIVIFGLVNCMGSCDKNPNMLPSDQQARIEIPDGSTTQDIATILYDAGIIENKKAFSNEVSQKAMVLRSRPASMCSMEHTAF